MFRFAQVSSFVLGRLFVGHPEAGERAAIIYSVLISCQRLEIDPLEYLRDILGKATRSLGEEELSALTSKNWKKENEAKG